MKPFAGMSGRRRVAVAAGIVLVGALALATCWPRADPWPARAVPNVRAAGLLEWGEDGRLVFGGRDGSTAVDPATGQSSPLPAGELILGRRYDRDRRRFVATAFPRGGPDTRAVVWGDAATGAVAGRFGDARLQAFHPTFEPDGRSIRVFLRDVAWPHRIRQVLTRDVATGAEVRRPITGPARLGAGAPAEVVAPDGRTIAYVDPAGAGVQLWDVDADRPLGPAFGAGPPPLAGPSPAIFTPDGQYLVVICADVRAEVRDRAGRLVRAFVLHDGFATEQLAIAPDGRTLASTGYALPPRGWPGLAARWLRSLVPIWHVRASREVVLVDLASGRRLARAAGVRDVHFAPDGRRVVTREGDGTYAVRDVPPPPGD